MKLNKVVKWHMVWQLIHRVLTIYTATYSADTCTVCSSIYNVSVYQDVIMIILVCNSTLLSYFLVWVLKICLTHYVSVKQSVSAPFWNIGCLEFCLPASMWAFCSQHLVIQSYKCSNHTSSYLTTVFDAFDARIGPKNWILIIASLSFLSQL